MSENKSNTSLFLVPTPIGNLGDITYRAVEVLQSVDLILCEDTRTSGKLLKHYGITTPTRSFHAYNENKVVDSIIEELKAGKRIAQISDAGTPGISDPGFSLARACQEEGIAFECLPGATSIIPALIKSGFPTDKFVFEGFLPHKKGRQTRLQNLASEERTIVLLESPHRIVKLMEQLKEHLGDEREISCSRELTKLYEETVNGTADQLLSHFSQKPPKGEFVVVIKAK
ncbi:MAG: 16S rRNA (cytidine(1402)-2'-O)-methyltransferase [Cyclobacteriaceae bacterium]|nr:16S rRNA (cytidine(1402)-2'-O)-methyltransferase [Cyclobacteriaceae bacterium]MCH8514825.1 16S rRNA (cytidine(1402)-2'-O)-methyltransferase [Cyclobacteriaceae bacterium]